MPIQFIRDLHAARRAAGRPVISFEFFPPKTDEGEKNLLEKTLPALLEIQPDYCSVTYGAGGGTREKPSASSIASSGSTASPPCRISHV